MVNKSSRVRQVRVNDMSLAQLKALLVRRERGVLYVKFLISQKES